MWTFWDFKEDRRNAPRAGLLQIGEAVFASRRFRVKIPASAMKTGSLLNKSCEKGRPRGFVFGMTGIAYLYVYENRIHA